MEYVCVSERFLFFNGVKRYTVEFCISLNSWYIFNEDEHQNACYIKRNNARKKVKVNRLEAEFLLFEYLSI